MNVCSIYLSRFFNTGEHRSGQLRQGTMNSSELLSRPLVMRLNTRQFSRLAQEEVLNGIEEVIDVSLVKAIQITESTCFVSLKNQEAKESLIIGGVNIRDTYNNVFDVEKIVTNVTIKDAPYELDDRFLIEYLRQYGEVVENSMKRGKVRGSDIETDIRYVQIVNCRIIPIITTFGRFKVRLFSDNTTECKFCGEVSHPYYRCPDRDEGRQAPKKRFRCGSTTHKISDCMNDIVCHFCQESGHKKVDCEGYKQSVARSHFGDYAHEILEGRQAMLDDSLTHVKTPLD